MNKPQNYKPSGFKYGARQLLPNRWLIWAFVAMLFVVIILLGLIEQMSIELDKNIAEDTTVELPSHEKTEVETLD